MPPAKKLHFETLKLISNTIKDLTHSGAKTVGRIQLSSIIEPCQLESDYIKHTFSKLMMTLKENHSEVRLTTLLVCNELFLMFKVFRELILESIDPFLNYILGENFNQELPPPKEVGKILIRTSIKIIDGWHSKFSVGEIRLRRLYEYLKEEKHMDFKTLEIFNPVLRLKEEKEAERMQIINKELLSKTTSEIYDLSSDIECTLLSLENCFNILIPSPENFEDSQNEPSCSSSNDLRAHGIYGINHILEINVTSKDKIEIEECDENKAVLENAKELYNLINKKYLPKAKAWLVLISKGEGSISLFKKAEELEYRLEAAVNKYNKLHIISNEESAVSTDSEMEDVDEEEIQEKTPSNCTVKNKCSFVETKIPVTKENKSKNNISERKQKLLEVAPTVPYDTDLYNWGDSTTNKILFPTSNDGHRFWASSSIESLEIPAESVRVIEFSGKFVPVTRACSAPLPSGKLCPRFDRVKCPLHGLIVPRDEKGKIINPEDELKVKKSTFKEEVPDWQDPKLLAEIKAATGMDLKIRKGRKKKHSNLTDIKKQPTPKERISKKIFNKGSIKRVSNTLDRLDFKKHRDKFGDQFNYVHNST